MDGPLYEYYRDYAATGTVPKIRNKSMKDKFNLEKDLYELGNLEGVVRMFFLDDGVRKIVLRDGEVVVVLRQLHISDFTREHSSQTTLYNLFTAAYTCPDMEEHVAEFMQNCESCAENGPMLTYTDDITRKLQRDVEMRIHQEQVVGNYEVKNHRIAVEQHQIRKRGDQWDDDDFDDIDRPGTSAAVNKKKHKK